MAYGVKALRRLQLGRESTAGAVVAATTVWRGEGVIEDTRMTEFPIEDIGLIPQTTRAYTPMLGSKLALSATPATFEQIAHIFEMGIKTVTATSDSTGSDYIYSYTMPTGSSTAMYLTPSTSSNPIKSYTIEGGDNNEAEVTEFCHVTDFELSFKAGEAVMVSANIAGRQVALQAFTSSTAATVPTVEEILASKGKVYIDSTTGTVGTTQITNEILSGSLKVKTGLKAVPTADGSLVFSFIKGVRPDVTLDLTFEHSTFAKAEKVFWRSRTPRLFQLKFEGSAFGTAGASYTYKTLIANLAGTYEKFSALEDEDGDDTITATVRGGYNSTAALFCQFIVANELSSLP